MDSIVSPKRRSRRSLASAAKFRLNRSRNSMREVLNLRQAGTFDHYPGERLRAGKRTSTRP